MHFIGMFKLIQCATIAIAYTVLEVDRRVRARKSKSLKASPE